MKMNVRMKVGIPIMVTVLLLGLVSYFFMHKQFSTLKDANIRDILNGKSSEIYQSLDFSSFFARDMAALFSRMPQVMEAYQAAFEGDINDERSPQSQTAREMLRRDLAPVLEGYKDIAGKDFQLHFHLPNGRSLVRLWRKKQAKRDGAWVDISDDLSSFRQTVLDVNRTGQPVQGIELGRGGFVIRGLAPIKGPDGKQLGSVEVLVDFAPILKAASKEKGQDILLYMNADLLPITTGLQDKEKYPLLADQYVLVSGSRDMKIQTLISPEFLNGGREQIQSEERGDKALAAFPIRDYRGQQIGVMVYVVDIAQQTAIIDQAVFTLASLLLAILVLTGLIGNMVVYRFVVLPVRRIMDKIMDIAEDRADLNDRLDTSQQDELGQLSGRFNQLMDKIRHILDSAQGYVNMLNAVPDPIFAVDKDWKIIAANTATQKMLGKDMNALKERRCMDLFNTEACETDDCPVRLAKDVQGFAQGKTMDLSRNGTQQYIQPVANVIHDSGGNIAGYVEIARDVTDLVLKEREIAANMERVERINRQTGRAARQISQTTADLTRQFDILNQGAAMQRDRSSETATAMEQMNATVLEVAQNASHAAEEADNAKAKAMEGADIVAQSVKAINEVRERALIMKENMDRLGSQADGIGQVMNVINDIADQTNLLALNAAIEAARAGDAGRGFAVVADEVRKLAEKTMHATKEVGDAIKGIQDGASQNIGQVDSTAQLVDTAAVLGNRSGEALQEIVKLIAYTSDQVQSIAAAAEEQSAASDEINRSVMDVTRIADEASDSIALSGNAVTDLAKLADRLKELADGKEE